MCDTCEKFKCPICGSTFCGYSELGVCDSPDSRKRKVEQLEERIEYFKRDGQKPSEKKRSPAMIKEIEERIKLIINYVV